MVPITIFRQLKAILVVLIKPKGWSDLIVHLSGFFVRTAEPRSIGSRASIKLPAGERPQGRRAFASHEVEKETRPMGVLKNIRKKKMNAQGGRCYYCDLPMWDDATARVPHEHCRKKIPLMALRCTAEHLHPRSEGGVNTADNIVAACWYCNNHRHRRKRPPSPKAHRQHVQQRMAAGKWLTAQFASWSSPA